MAGGIMVDANVLLDILTDDPQWRMWSAGELRSARASGQILVNPIICAEVAPAFDFDWSRIDAWLTEAAIMKVPLPFAASTVAAAAHCEYRKRGGSREKPLPDFFIGAHAEGEGHTVLTRAPTRFRTSFPSVSLICPV
jgi:predicted nucleic acid-binding protein